MHIFIDNKSGVPIYDQFFSQIKNQIISGTIGEDEPLPSIRNLAKELRIGMVSPIIILPLCFWLGMEKARIAYYLVIGVLCGS